MGERGAIVGIAQSAICVPDVEATRERLAEHGVEFLTSGVASIARLRTTWFRDPWGVVFILMEKRDPTKPYFAQY